MFSRIAAGPAQGPRMPLSPALVKDKVMFRRFLDIAGARDVQPVVLDVRGRSADLVIDYALVSDTKVRMYFTRRDTWTFTRGNDGWLLDAISVNDERFRRLEFPDGSTQIVTNSRYDAATGNVMFSLRTRSFVWTPDSHWGWKIVALASPTPVPTTIAQNTPAPSPSPSERVAVRTAPATATPHAPPTARPSARPAASIVPTAAAHASPAPHASPAAHATTRPVARGNAPHLVVARTPGARAAATRPPAAVAAVDPYSDCTTASVDSVSEDGSVVTLAGGRRYYVREAQRYLSAMWIAEDEVTVCDPGPERDARITHRGDVVYAGHAP
jgi:hypothetical protein